MIALEVGDLVTIASRTLGLDTGQVLDLLDPAAEHALTQVRPGSKPSDPAPLASASGQCKWPVMARLDHKR